MRFHLIDRIDEIHQGRYVVAVKCISLADDVFDEHFPGYPIFPGSLILEGVSSRDYALVQAGVLVISTIFVTVNLAVDLIYGLIDPRIRYQ